MNDHPVRPGQVWRDNDPRQRGRLIHIIDVEADGRARCRSRGRTVRIRLDRFKPTSNGYVLHKEAPEND